MLSEDRKIYLANLEFHNELTPLHERYMQGEISLEEFGAGLRALEEFWGNQLTFELNNDSNKEDN